MKKILVGLSMAGSLAISGIAAETSGSFVGVDIGIGGIQAERNRLDDSTLNFKEEASALDVKVRGGKKWFFNDYLGIRAHGYVSYFSGTANKEGWGEIGMGAYTLGVGADVLVNFINDLGIINSAGVFAGPSLGFGFYAVDPGYYDGFAKQDPGIGFGTEFAINFGVRAVLEENHSVEIGVSVPSSSGKIEYKGRYTDRTVEEWKINKQSEVTIGYVHNF